MARNGQLDRGTMTLVDGWAYLAPATAASWNAACAALVALGYPRPTITAPDGAYRTLAGQVYWRAYWVGRGKPGNAAIPGTSNHGWATAVDIHNVAKFYRPDLVRVFAAYGFTFNVPSENWHVQHDGSWPAAVAGGGHTPIEIIPELPEEEDMELIYIRAITNGKVDSGVKGVIGSINITFRSPGERNHFINLIGTPEKPRNERIHISYHDVLEPDVSGILNMFTR